MNSARLGRSESPQLLVERSEPCQGRIKRRNGKSSGRTRSHSNGRFESSRGLAGYTGRFESSRGLAGYTRGLSLPRLDAAKSIAAVPDTRHDLQEMAGDTTLKKDSINTKAPMKFQNLWEFAVVEVMDVDTLESELYADRLVASEAQRLVETWNLGLGSALEKEGFDTIQVVDVDTKEVLKMKCPDIANKKFRAIADVPEGPPVNFRSPEPGEISVEMKAFLREHSANPGIPAEIEVVFDL